MNEEEKKNGNDIFNVVTKSKTAIVMKLVRGVVR